MDLYVMGGSYRKSSRTPGSTYYEHSLVKPTNGNPYVFTNPEGSTYNLCKHHSHLYRLDENHRTATLVRHSSEASEVLAPQTLVLGETDYNGVQERINGQGPNGPSAD